MSSSAAAAAAAPAVTKRLMELIELAPENPPLTDADVISMKMKAVSVDEEDKSAVVATAIHVHGLLNEFKCKVLIPLLPATWTVADDVGKAREDLEEKISAAIGRFTRTEVSTRHIQDGTITELGTRTVADNGWPVKILARRVQEVQAMFEWWLAETIKEVKEMKQ